LAIKTSNVTKTLYTLKLFEGKYIYSKSKRGLTFMLVNFVWNVFQTTGSIESYVLMKEIEAKYQLKKAEDVIQEESQYYNIKG